MCDVPFFANAGNYVGFKEHDKNPRKFWFLVLGHGLFTKKTDADAVAGSSKVLIFFTRNEAREKWAKYCLRRHTHGGDGEDGDGASASSDEDSASMRSVLPTLGRQTRVAGAAAHRTPLRTAPKATPPPKRESSRVSVPLPVVSPRPQSHAPVKIERVKKEFKLPLYRDDTPPMEMEMDAAPIGKATVGTTALKTGATLSRNANPATPPPAVFSSLVSSVSSISSTSSEGHSLRHPTASKSAVHAPPSPLRFLNRAPAASPQMGASAPLPPATRAPTAGSSASAAPRAHAAGSSAQPAFLYNETSRKLYKNVQKALQEMANGDSVQVVDYEDVSQYLSAGRRVGSV
ncbi:hypothetical protein DFH08DRAFT_968335 [Mycena albidolilacea]|uniref:Uncharacterized protein n=1 Tax=Mycena albidolilacea TaxID=1033008 RepID=A0AAD7EJG8_9AGAR|nr:hypothetical protein DFH08DRAFT_968335 [Mycena albidolilacea]